MILPVIITIGIYINVYLYWQYQYRQGDIVTSLRSASISITPLISVIIFGTLLFAKSNSFNSIGSIAIAGIIGVYISTLFFLPSIILLVRAFAVKSNS
jgi:predicted RND superfamily exporter protein